MFLKGIFGHQNLGQNRLSSDSLDKIHTLFYGKTLPSVVKNNLLELSQALENGVEFASDSSVLWYSLAIEKNKGLSLFNEKVRHKEFAMHSFEEGETMLPRGTVDENTISSEHSLVEQPKNSWMTLAGKGTVEALDFKDEVIENIDIYNNVTDYLDRTYGLNFKLLLKNSLNGVDEAVSYLKMVSSSEEDEEFIEALTFLSAYEEFFDYIHSSESEVLKFDFSVKSVERDG